MRTCVIFNPAANGQKAERLRAQLDVITQHAVLKQTAAAGDARRLAAEAIAGGCDTVIAAGGDGTINEVLNGIADADAFHRVRLGVLPLGTVNVFARELKIPTDPVRAWKLILRGRYTRIDLGWAEFSKDGRPERHHFMQMAGAGLDARAIELVDGQQKKKIGSLAYVVAGWKALREPQPMLTVTAGERWAEGELVLIGNGKLYGGRLRILPEANLRDGLLDICVFPRVKMASALGHALHAAVFRELPEKGVRRLRAAEFSIGGTTPAGFELDGELIGKTPVRFGVDKERLRVIVP
jgi:YegS/Rv2252/BmrU family lipid kinase